MVPDSKEPQEDDESSSIDYVEEPDDMRLQVGGGRPSNPPAENAPKAKRVYHMQRIRRARLNLKQMN